MKRQLTHYHAYGLAFLLLSLGTGNYYLLNSHIRLFHDLGMEHMDIRLTNSLARSFFSGYFSDITWCAALYFIAWEMENSHIIHQPGKWILLSLPFFSEFFQYLRIIPGTFDWLDILAYLIVLAIFLIPFHKLKIKIMKKYLELVSVGGIFMLFLLMALASAPAKQVADTQYNGYFKMPNEKDEAVTNSAKLQNLRLSANPSIVLRVPNASREVTQEDNNIKTQRGYGGVNNLNDINVYNVIEKELLKGGFTVRDRALFEKVLGDKNVSDYSKIKELTETDLILELSSIEYVRYPSNSFNFYTTTRRKGTVENTLQCSNYFDLYGLKLEFRLIQVKDNDFIGSFTYYYNPCEDNACNYNISVSATNACSAPYINQGNTMVTGTNLISQADIENFVEQSTRKMVHEILNNH